MHNVTPANVLALLFAVLLTAWTPSALAEKPGDHGLDAERALTLADAPSEAELLPASEPRILCPIWPDAPGIVGGAFCSVGNVIDTLAAARDLVDRILDDPVGSVPSLEDICHFTMPQDCPL